MSASQWSGRGGPSVIDRQNSPKPGIERGIRWCEMGSGFGLFRFARKGSALTVGVERRARKPRSPVRSRGTKSTMCWVQHGRRKLPEGGGQENQDGKRAERQQSAGGTVAVVGRHAKISVTGRPFAIGNGRFRLSRTSVWGSTPRAWYIVAARSPGVTGSRSGKAPVRSDRP